MTKNNRPKTDGISVRKHQPHVARRVRGGGRAPGLAATKKLDQPGERPHGNHQASSTANKTRAGVVFVSVGILNLFLIA